MTKAATTAALHNEDMPHHMTDKEVVTKKEKKKRKKEKKKHKKKKHKKESKKRSWSEDSSSEHKAKRRKEEETTVDSALANGRVDVVEVGQPRELKKKKKKRRKEETSRDDTRGGHLNEEQVGRKMVNKVNEMDTEDKNDVGSPSRETPGGDDHTTEAVNDEPSIRTVPGDDKIVVTSALDFSSNAGSKEDRNVTLLLFYQYVEPPWDSEFYKDVLKEMQRVGTSFGLTGRMRVAKEGLNCTLTSSHNGILQFCAFLRAFHKGEFKDTEFKLTTDLPHPQAFPELKIIPVTELVHYGLAGERAPPMEYTGVHLEPKDYHTKLNEENTVVIDVRNHYEAAIGHFSAPNSKWVDPKMRKSTEFPVWLDKEETKQQLKGKQVLMYCTGGVRCERASSLLKYKLEHDPGFQEMDIQGVYQLQGGIDKYLKAFPDGGFWEGKNYTFDKRFAHAAPKKEGEMRRQPPVMGKCEACHKPWDMYRGKRRCPTCGVPSLICRDCFQADKDGIRKLDKRIRCELCVEENITSKQQLRQRDQQELEEYESKLADKGDKKSAVAAAANPDGVTRLLLKNMSRNRMDEDTLTDFIPGITHIVWKTDRKTGKFFGSAWVEMATPEDAARAVGKNGKRVLGRPLYVSYQPPDGKDAWPPPSSRVQRR